MKKYFFTASVLLSSLLFSQTKEPEMKMNSIAEQYVKLILAVGQHDADYVDAYYGPKEWLDEAKTMKYQLTALHDWTEALQKRIAAVKVSSHDKLLALRKTYITKQLSAAHAKIEMLMGKKYSFDDEAKKLYDAAPPTYSESHFKKILQELDAILPDSGSIHERYEKFHNQFVIPKEKIDTVFKAAITECRARTKMHIALPDSESFVVEYVHDKAWSGYNWYQGGAHSLIQVNIDYPIFIDRAVDLAAHEGYPGHHVYNVLLESEMLKKHGWIEFCIYPLFSPQSLIAEGSANYGIDVVLPNAERLKFEKETLFPLAGLDTTQVEHYYKVQALTAKLAYAGNEAARGYLNGTITKEQAVDWLVTYSLSPRERAEQRIRFIEKYRAYVINYNLGQDLVKQFVEKKSGKNATPEKRWDVFRDLISSPRLPSELK
ncbi:MAG: hypothetical protein PHP42_02725 [Bacteroidota bacterium]|nr:hypothetical protein [Bacteroidota bacterium]